MIVIDLPDEAATASLAARLAREARAGDIIALKGALGAGKTSFARAFIRARTGTAESVPSPTFTLVQTYAAGDFEIWHFDLYRLASPEDSWELGIEDSFRDAVSLIEWPERLGALLPSRRLEVALDDGADDGARQARLDGDAAWMARLEALGDESGHRDETGLHRETPSSSLTGGEGKRGGADTPPLAPPDPERRQAIDGFLAAAGWAGTVPRFLAGDASFRRYYRLAAPGRRAVLMDAPPPHERVGPFVAVAAILRGLGLSAPEIFAEDDAAGLLLLEDFGDDTYTRLLAGGADETNLYALAIDTLAALHRAVAREGLPTLPPYDTERLLAEAELLVDWYAPSVLPGPLSLEARAEYRALWREILPRAAPAEPTLVLRDYHVDNLVLLAEREGVRRCGLLDFQDALCGPPAYDFASLVEDARRDVPASLRQAMAERYLASFPESDPLAFARSAAILAAQRNAKIVGIFTRLSVRDGKPQYLAHIPHVWRLIADECRREPSLAPFAQWLDRHLPPARRVVPQAPEKSR